MSPGVRMTGKGLMIAHRGPKQAMSLHGATPTTQRAGADQAAVPSAAIAHAAGANPTQAEYDALVDQVNAQTTLLNELRASVVEKGMIKGAA